MKHYILLILILFSSEIAAQQQFRIPPSETTSRYVPVISDEEMEKCVSLYNQALWLEKELESTMVNQYDPDAVNAYNARVDKHSNLIKQFNRNCAGKQSKSACEAAKKLNEEQGLASQSCRAI